jgi:hypothetical protein
MTISHVRRYKQGRGPGVLQKNNRKFADVYEQDQPGYGAGGHHGGSSGAARRSWTSLEGEARQELQRPMRKSSTILPTTT